MKLVPSTPANIYTTTAFVVGLLLADDLTPAEQNSLGNWFMMVGQALCTNSAQQQVLNNRNQTSNSSNAHIINDNNLQQSVNNIRNEVNNILKKDSY